MNLGESGEACACIKPGLWATGSGKELASVATPITFWTAFGPM